ncbi:MAG: single-stranded DNA-binding protein [Butyrivibrio sp.]|nr:single-stranded DNA-binding protein [Butyrivibrio sp.]
MNEHFANVKLTGRVVTEPTVLTEYGIEKIYEAQIEYKRTSDKTDRFIINYSSGLDLDIKKDMLLLIDGTVRTTKFEQITKIYVKIDNAKVLDEEPEIYTNEVVIKGVLAKAPRIRKSYKDETTDITDLTVKVERNQTKASYLPVVAWNNNARLASQIAEGEEINIRGRLQSHTTKNGYLMTEITTTSFRA